ncbi:nucleotide-binding domain-containing protein [Acidithrix ferrooxidans]|uniref:Adenylyl/Guanylyl and SMODS C-terminal sensor domain-containing protein n=1 Tax=Acidithrix ferrooxidans TaxID=1280514 RepID=A0A0D8HLS2_9ACTN|nr:nucleotidyltransferase [Acidithrix ferrooxidans]KJF18046.1 hypothetical protein AXFE_11450 [Acidithrix ferrooxidans]
MSVDLGAYFNQFLQNISLGEPQISRMNSAAEAISRFLVQQYGVPSANVFVQGSYANNTVVEPVDGGEYDIDLVAVCVGPNVSSDKALDELETAFRSTALFSDRVTRKQPCVRLEYAHDHVGSFHVDVVPVRWSGQATPPLEAPRREDGWHGTAPAEYTQWCRNQGPLYIRTVMAMKRWRDEQQPVRNAVKSIVLQVLVSQYMPQTGDDASRMAETFKVLHSDLSRLRVPPVVPNPVLPSENLAKRWTAESFNNFVVELKEAVEWATTIQNTTDIMEAADACRELLGNDFPVLSPKDVRLELLDYSHAQTPAQMGWLEAYDSRYQISIKAVVQRGKRGQTRRPLLHDGELLLQGHNLHFKADLVAPNHVDVWWQVANTGGHARSVNELRGEIFKGKNLQGKLIAEDENWESTAYTGSHLIRSLLVRENRVLAVSPWFQVNIYAKGQPFRR